MGRVTDEDLLRVLVVAVMGGCALAGVGQTAPVAAAAPAAPALLRWSWRSRLATAQAKLMDWPQLGGTGTENAALAAPAAGEQRVVFYGDSITDGWGGGRATGRSFRASLM